jgi:hypothetical protein
VCACVCVCVYMCARRTYVCMCVYVGLCVCTYVCVYVYIYIYIHTHVCVFVRTCACLDVCLCYLASCFETSGKYICLFLHLIHCAHGNSFGCPEGLVGYDQHIRLLVVTLSVKLWDQLQTTSLQILACYWEATLLNWSALANMLRCVRQIPFNYVKLLNFHHLL